MQRILSGPAETDLTIEVGRGDLEFHVSDSWNDIEVILDPSGAPFEEAAERTALINGTLTVPTVAGTRPWDGDTGGLRIIVRIPATVRVTAKVLRGDVTSTGMLTDASLDVGTGHIRLGYIHGNTWLRSGDGSLVIDAMSGTLNATAHRHDITLRWGTGRIFLNAFDGDICANVECPSEMRATTEGGSITISGLYCRKDVSARARGRGTHVRHR